MDFHLDIEMRENLVKTTQCFTFIWIDKFHFIFIFDCIYNNEMRLLK